MKENLKHIVSGQGLGNLLFGMSRNDVVRLLGEPVDKEMNSYTSSDGDKYETWHYDELEMSMSFSEEENWKLDSIAINSSHYLLFDTSLYGKSVIELKRQLKEWNIEDVEFEDCSTIESPSHTLLSTDILGINFWFDNDRLSEIQWGPLFVDDDTISWPKLRL